MSGRATGEHVAERPTGTPAGDLLRTVLGLGLCTVRMAEAEAPEVARRAGRRLVALLLCAALLVAGAAVLLVGAAVALETVWALPRWAALTIPGAAALVGGAAGAIVALHRLADPAIAFPRTRAELRKDVESAAGAVDPR